MLFTQNPYLAAVLCVIFLPFTVVYYLAVTIRHFLYDSCMIKSYTSDIPTISIGNITVGGTGKTPTVISLVNSLSEKGLNSLVVTGGYGRNSHGRVTITENTPVSESGDEPFTIYRKTKAKVICDKDRTSALKDMAGNYDLAVLDDAFQHRKLKKNLDIVLIDERRFLGNHLLLPSGILRDKISRLIYADIIILSKVKDINSSSVKDKLSYLKKFGNKILISKLDYSSVSDGTVNTDLKVFLPMKISLFCGIGNPEDFFNIFSSYNIISKTAFSDHCSYTRSEFAELKQLKTGSDVLITTYKDFVKIPDVIIKELNIRYLEIDLIFYNESLTEFDISDVTKGIVIGKK